MILLSLKSQQQKVCVIARQGLVFQLFASLRRSFCGTEDSSGQIINTNNIDFDSNLSLIKQKGTP